MSFSPDKDLEFFARRFFEVGGAVLEERDGAFDILAPPELCRRLGTPEYFRLVVGAAPDKTGDSGTNAVPLHYGSPLLEKMISVAGATATVVKCSINIPYLKREGFDKLIDGQFTFHGAKGNVASADEDVCPYVLLTIRYVAQSDEQKEGLMELAFNGRTGALVEDFHKGFETAERSFRVDTGDSGPEGDMAAAATWVKRYGPGMISERIREFKQRMERRFQRDAESLHAYYTGLQQEMEDSLQRPGLSPQSIRDRREKIALLPQEHERKKHDLLNKYSIRVTLYLCGVVHTATPCVKIRYQLSIGKKRKALPLYYNPLTKSMEPLVCRCCSGSTYSVAFSDNLDELCPNCARRSPL